MDTTVKMSEFTQWIPRDYLRDYYSTVQEDEKATIKYLCDVFKTVKNNPLMIEFGTGPTLHHVFAAAPYVSEIHMADYLQNNLDEVKAWVDDKNGRHSWYEFVKYTLQCEGIKNPTDEQILERKDLTRKKIKKYIVVDAGKELPAGKPLFYPLVLSCYCADSATSDKSTWNRYMKNIISMTEKGGTFITTALRKAKHYKVGNHYFPSAYVDEKDFARVLSLDFSLQNTTINVQRLEEHDSVGYSSILLAHATHKK